MVPYVVARHVPSGAVKRQGLTLPITFPVNTSTVFPIKPPIIPHLKQHSQLGPRSQICSSRGLSCQFH